MSVLSDYADAILLSCSSCASDLCNGRNALYSAGEKIAEQDWNAAKNYLYEAGNYFGYAAGHISKSPPWPPPGLGQDLHAALDWIDDNIGDGEPPEEYELTWKKICEAWIANDFEGRAMTIAVIDRMRQILWDEPFNVVWAARPEF